MTTPARVGRRSGASRFWRRFSANKGAVIGLGVLLGLGVLTLAAPRLVSNEPWSIVGRPFVPPSWEFILGTDTLGRDILSGILYGARVSLMIGIAAAVISTVIGVVVGALAAYYGGWTDEMLMRVTEYFQIVPNFVLALVLVAVFQPSLLTLVGTIGFVGWPAMARVVRAEFLSLRTREFVLAERALGAGDAKIIFQTILPNALPIIVVYSSLLVATSILFESSLSFLGLGDPNHISWGFMIGASRSVLRLAWWMPAFPGLAILITVLSINLVGDGLNDALNPRAKPRAGAEPAATATTMEPPTAAGAVSPAPAERGGLMVAVTSALQPLEERRR
jgi:peptide/nickel transport system permease protein